MPIGAKMYEQAASDAKTEDTDEATEAATDDKNEAIEGEVVDDKKDDKKEK